MMTVTRWDMLAKERCSPQGSWLCSVSTSDVAAESQVAEPAVLVSRQNLEDQKQQAKRIVKLLSNNSPAEMSISAGRHYFM